MQMQKKKNHILHLQFSWEETDSPHVSFSS